jgi:hypothetical protein
LIFITDIRKYAGLIVQLSQSICISPVFKVSFDDIFISKQVVKDKILLPPVLHKITRLGLVMWIGQAVSVKQSDT